MGVTVAIPLKNRKVRTVLHTSHAWAHVIYFAAIVFQGKPVYYVAAGLLAVLSLAHVVFDDEAH